MSGDQEEYIRKFRSWAMLALLVCYFIPLVLITLYNTSLLPLDQGWPILTIGMIAALLGSTVLFLVLRHWEGSVALQRWAFAENAGMPPEPDPEWRNPLPPGPVIETATPDVEELHKLQQLLLASQRQCEALGVELHTVQRSMQELKHEREELEHLHMQAEQAINHQKNLYEEQLNNKETLLEEYQQTILDQRAVIELKQQALVALETEKQDLKYEIKTLVDLSDRLEESVPAAPPVVQSAPKLPPKSKIEKIDPTLDLGLVVTSRSTEEAQQQLKRCIDIAQKLTGARHLAGDSSRFRDLSSDGFALDFRRLCDSLRSEQSSMILLFSQRENKALFVNDQVRALLGWTADKFLQNFFGVMEDSLKEWRVALQKAATNQRSEAILKMKTRSGDEASVRCLLGNVPTGIFKTHIIAIFYPS